jgi:hypothetical protein
MGRGLVHNLFVLVWATSQLYKGVGSLEAGLLYFGAIHRSCLRPDDTTGLLTWRWYSGGGDYHGAGEVNPVG